ncbi:cytochrome P460 family protein [Pinisolibacter sp.]|uniref:cytochrome P460 family protein n=1 Tax=Pinisolibacter sp. TaxID=2172024 RepID=UPI002FDD1AEE
MNRSLSLRAAIAAGLAFACVVAVHAEDTPVRFPSGYAKGVHYATINRGDTREELFTSREAVDALKAGKPLPSGTVITMEDYRSDVLFRYVVLEKRIGWSTLHPPGLRTGDWEFQWFNPDRTVKTSENLDRCRSCHVSQASQDYLFTSDRIRSVP